MIIQVICAFLAIFSFSIIIQVPKKYQWCAGLVGALGWAVYLIFVKSTGMVVATFISAVCIAIIAHVFARLFKSPVLVFLIPGILTLVPGAGMYKSVYQLFMGSESLSAQYLLQTIEVAGMIALAIFIVDSFVYLIPKKKIKKKEE